MEMAMDPSPTTSTPPIPRPASHPRNPTADEAHGPPTRVQGRCPGPGLRGLLAGQKKTESLGRAEAAVQLKPDDPNILQTAAQAFIAWDKKDRALAVFGPKAVAKIGDDAMLLNNYAWFWAQQGTNLESALTAVQRSIALEDRDWSEDTLAVVLLGLGRLDDAAAAVNKAIAMSSTPSRYKPTEQKIKDAIEKRKQGSRRGRNVSFFCPSPGGMEFIR
jgi:Tfp pilus assembly protein PilF